MPDRSSNSGAQSSASDVHPAIPRGVEEALRSRTFEKTPGLKSLLAYLWEHRDDDLSEYKIATEALYRRQDFDPHFDAAVRVQTGRLRKRLNKFYEEEGSQLPTRLDIPLGAYRVHLREMELESKAEEKPSIFKESISKDEVSASPQFQISEKRRKTFSVKYITIALVLLLSNGIMFLFGSHYRHSNEPGQTNRLPVFWQQFLGNGKHTSIIIPNPAFFLWPHHIVARDWRVSDVSRLSDSEPLAMLAKHYGEPIAVQYYADTAEASASWRLDRFLDPAGTQIVVSGTKEFPTAALDWDNNLIAFGTTKTLSIPFQAFLDRMSFQMDMGNGMDVAIDRHPLPGAPTRFEGIEKSPSRFTYPSVIALLPGETGDTQVMLISTSQATSLVTYLVSKSGSEELENARAAHGNCRFFEAVILTETSGKVELGSHIVAFKPYQEK